MNNNSEHLSIQFPSGYFVSTEGSPMSIQAAATRGFIYKSDTKGCVVINGATIEAKHAVAAGMIDKAAADYISTLEGTDKPGGFTRVDNKAPEPEYTKLDTAKGLIDALSGFFLNPNAFSKQVVIAALTAHLDASSSEEPQTA